MTICLGYGGSITGEHGVGIEKRKYMPQMYSPAELSAMRDIKEVFDPQGIMNPGKIFPEGAGMNPEIPPAVAIRSVSLQPASTVEASETLRAYAAAGQPLTVRGGSSLAPEGARGVVLSTRWLDRIHTLALEDLYVTAGAGLRLSELQSVLERTGTWVPLSSPWEQATLGGILAANFNAPLRMRYGALRDLMLAATLVLPDGRVIHAGRPVMKNVAGYDLPKLFVGAFGTLGLMTEATLKLSPLPRRRATLLAPVETLQQGLEWGMQLLPVCLTASALLLFHTAPGFTDAPYTLVYTAEGVAEDVEAELEEAQQVLQAAGASQPTLAEDFSGSQAWADWLGAGFQPVGDLAMGESKLSSGLARLGVGCKDLPGLVLEQSDILEEAAFVADLAAGMLYLRGPVVFSALRAAALRLGGYAIQTQGGVSPAGEPWGYEPQSLELMQKLKRKWDPGGRFNAGEFIV
jgi:D-lactate dehydrogenase (cytochrome)